jgi:hypothetical protein
LAQKRIVKIGGYGRIAQMNKKRTEIVIPKDQAVFWLDKNGRWHNEHGEFQHKKIINYFNTSIHKDENGYFLFQQDENISEKVYFHYEDTALFAVDLIKEKDITLVLNTRKRLKLKPKNLWIRDDSLYMHTGGENIKFIERGLMKISDLLEMTNNQYAIKVSGRRYRIPQK